MRTLRLVAFPVRSLYGTRGVHPLWAQPVCGLRKHQEFWDVEEVLHGRGAGLGGLVDKREGLIWRATRWQ